MLQPLHFMGMPCEFQVSRAHCHRILGSRERTTPKLPVPILPDRLRFGTPTSLPQPHYSLYFLFSIVSQCSITVHVCTVLNRERTSKPR
jgi:hypothetical protein